MIVVFGSINLDLIGKVSRIPRPGETVPGSEFSSAPGGKGANQALAARRAGATVRMIGAVGSDAFAGEAIALLDKDGVDLGGVKRSAGATGVAMIFVDDAGENVIGILPGANGTVSAADAEAALAALGEDDYLIVQQEIGQAATRRALEVAKARGAITVLNTAPFLETTAETAKLAQYVIANETEFDLMTGTGDRGARMRAWAKATEGVIIVTLGPEGAIATTPHFELRAAALKIVPIDTVGAGDTFVGYFVAGLAGGLDIAAAMARGATAASLACLTPGAQPAIPYWAAVDAALKSGSR